MALSRSILFLAAWIPFALHPGNLEAQVQGNAPDAEVMKIVRQMKEVLEPDRPSVRKIDISVSGENRLNIHWEARKATATLPDGKWALIVLLDPPNVRGSALLVQEREGSAGDKWVYLPSVRRVRRILPVTAYEYFFNSDFTYADLGFVPYAGSYERVGEEQHSGEAAYKLIFCPKDPWYYSRIVMWVSKETHLPLERNYYDIRGLLWKKETFEQVTVIDGIPTPLRIKMEDVQFDRRSVFDISEVAFDVAIPKELFNPAMLPKAAEAPFWKKLEPDDE